MLNSVRMEPRLEPGDRIATTSAGYNGAPDTISDVQRALLNILEDLTEERATFNHGQRALLNILDDLTIEQTHFENGQKALLNILDDLTGERAGFNHGQRALLNILDDLTTEQTHFKHGQKALLNILDDLTQERASFNDGQRALLNILDDTAVEKANLQGSQRAVLNILEDFDQERSKVEVANRDLTHEVEERRRAQEEIKTLNRELEQRVTDRTTELAASNKELEAFAYSVSHDLRAPLRHIDGFLALLTRRLGKLLDDQNRTYMTKVTAASRNMGNLIDDLLQFSRMGRSEINKTTVNLETIVQDCRQELELETTGRTITWEVGRLPLIVADVTMMRMVMMNLISNALKFTRKCGKTHIQIGCTTDKAGEDVVFVKDNGAGFDMQYVDKLFNVFQRLHSATDFEGTGIGLANVRRIVERHGGKVWAQGEVGSGATFFFSMPKNQVHHPDP